MIRRRRTLICYTALLALLILIDRISKDMALFSLAGKDVDVFPGLTLSLSMNRGISCSLITPQTANGYWILAGIIGTLLIGFFAYAVFEFRQNRSLVFEIFIFAGGISNFLDRILLGGVVDFIDFHVMGWHWPTFNVADICVVAGAIGIIMRTWYGAFQNPKNVR